MLLEGVRVHVTDIDAEAVGVPEKLDKRPADSRVAAPRAGKRHQRFGPAMQTRARLRSTQRGWIPAGLAEQHPAGRRNRLAAKLSHESQRTVRAVFFSNLALMIEASGP
jgi:hypothetical protein